MTTFHHVAISSSDAGNTVTFYEKLGFRNAFTWASPDGDLRIIHLKLGDCILEVFNYRNAQDAPETMQALETDLRRLGVKHFGLRVSNIVQARQRMLDLKFADKIEIKEGRTGIKYFFIRDPDGNWVEIVQDDRSI
jgi:glyoxylase I family protein